MKPDTPHIEYYRLALLRMLEALFALAGIKPGGAAVARLPTGVISQIRRVLQASESAVRRLVMVLAEDLPKPALRKRAGPVGKIVRGNGDKDRVPCFGLFDARKSFPELAHLSPQRKRIVPAHLAPRIIDFDRPFTPRPPKPEPPVRDPQAARRVCRRMQALHHALQDLQAQARRMKRAMAKAESAPPGPKCYGPRRPGWPPGYRPEQTHPVDVILWECDQFARVLGQSPPALSCGSTV